MRKRYLKTSISVDTTQKGINRSEGLTTRVHDILHAEKLLKQSHKTKQSNLSNTDKGYDSEEIHRLVSRWMNLFRVLTLIEDFYKAIKDFNYDNWAI